MRKLQRSMNEMHDVREASVATWGFARFNCGLLLKIAVLPNNLIPTLYNFTLLAEGSSGLGKIRLVHICKYNRNS